MYRRGIVSTILLVASFLICIYYSINHTNVNETESNQCLMTWMVPNFIPLKIPEEFTFEKKWKLYNAKQNDNNNNNNNDKNNNNNCVHAAAPVKEKLILNNEIQENSLTGASNIHKDDTIVVSTMKSNQETIIIETSPNKDCIVNNDAQSTLEEDSSTPIFYKNSYSFEIKDHWIKPYVYDFYLYKESNHYTLELKGVPVLFLHGNSGSYLQARSLGSSLVIGDVNSPYNEAHIGNIKERFGWFAPPSLKKEIVSQINAEKDNLSQESIDESLLDLFTLDFKEELSGLHAEVIEKQALYVNDAIDFILNGLYKNTKHDSVIIVAHSMGGIVARLAPMMLNYKPGTINTIFTLATPHIGHPFYVEDSIVKLISKMNRYWMENIKNSDSDISNIAIVSIASGFRDTMIRDDITRLHEYLPDSHQISVSSYEIPGVRVACDHMSIIWCKQMSHMLSLAILKLVTHKGNLEYRFTLDHTTRMQILRQTFLGSRPTALLNKMVKSVPSYDIENIEENESVSAEQIFGKVSAQVITPSREYFIIDDKVMKNNDDHIFAIDIESALKANADFLSIYCNVQFMDYQVLSEFAVGRSDNLHYKFFDLKEYGEILPHVITRERHIELSEYPIHMAKSLYQLPIKTLKQQYGYNRIILRFAKELKNPRCAISATNLAVTTTTEYVNHWSLPSAWVQGKPYRPIGSYNSPTQRIKLPNLSRHLPYNFRILPKMDCPNALAPSLYFVGANSKGERIQERWQSNKNYFPVMFSSSSSDGEGFSLLIETDPCWEGFSVEARISLEHFVPLVIYFQKNRIVTYFVGWTLFLLAIQATLKYTSSLSDIISRPLIFLTLSFPGSVFLGLITPYMESVLTYLNPDHIQASIIYPTSMHQSSPLYVISAAILSCIMATSFTFTFDILIALSNLLFYFPSLFLRKIFDSPKDILKPLFKVSVIISTIGLLRFQAGIPLFAVFLSQLVYVSLLPKVNHAQKSFIIISILLTAFFVPGAILWIFEVNNRVTKERLSLMSLLKVLPHRSFVNPAWYLVLPFFIVIFLNFTNEYPSASTAIPLLIASLLTFTFSTTLYLAKVFISFAMFLYICQYLFFFRNVPEVECQPKRPIEVNHYEIKVKGE